ncbi:MAG: hypothetical protein ACREVO_11365 [Steroidobacteraceae bacterium]
MLGPSTLAVFAAYDVNEEKQPSDQELATNFFSHEARFDELAQMLAAHRPSLAAKGATSVDLARVERVDKGAARFKMYRVLLRQISVADLRYFPDSGELALVPEGQENLDQPRKFYLYLPHIHPQSLVQNRGYNWREPGMSIVTGDHPLKGFWYIHHEVTIEVAVNPY